MKTRVQAKRKTSSNQEHQKPWAKLQPRPFATEAESNTDTPIAPSLNQAQLDRIAHPPNLAAMPLYSAEAIATSGGDSAALQARASTEPNLKPPQGTLQRQAEDQKGRKEELLQTAADPTKAEEKLQMQPAPASKEEEKLHTQLAEKEKKAVQKQAEIGAEAEQDEIVQTQLEAEQEETLQRQVGAEAAEEDVMQTGQDLAIAQDKKKAK